LATTIGLFGSLLQAAEGIRVIDDALPDYDTDPDLAYAHE
jgi:hypothetical protein